MNPNEPQQDISADSMIEPTPAPMQSTQPDVDALAQSQPDSTAMPQPQAAATAPNLHEIFDQIAEKIIEQQEAIIGPIAVDRAKQVTQLKIDWPQHDVDVQGNPQMAIDELVSRYKELFGQIAVETCKEAASRYLSQLSPDQTPSSLK